MNKLQWALYWASRGFRVFPLWPSNNKPAWDDFPNRATCDTNIITAAWSSGDFNIGAVPTGQVMVDMDEKKGKHGVAAAQQLGLNFDTLLVRTTTGGLHAWYEGPPTANSAGKIAEGIDTRGPGGYAVMPGSVINGLPYEIVQDKPLAPVQQFVLDKLKAPRDRSQDQTPLVDLDTDSALALAERYLDTTSGALAGSQNDTLFRVAAHVRDLGVSESLAAELIDRFWAVKCEPQIPSEEVEQIVSNAYLYAQNPPGSKHPFADFAGYVPTEMPPLPTPNKPQQLGLFDDNPFASFGNLIDLADLAPRDWCIKRFLERKAVTTLVAPGGIGKSQFTLTLAAYLARGEEDFFGFENVFAGQPQYSVIYNAEDDENEMSARLHALCVLRNWDYHSIKPYISLVSGKRQRFKLMTRGSNGRPVMDEEAQRLAGLLISACLSRRCVLLGLDPLTKLHELNENDNIEMGRFMENLARLADLANVAALLSHHMSKPAFASNAPYAGNAAAGRGAGEIINGSRAAYTLSMATQDDIAHYGLNPDQAIRLLRLDNAKLNRALMRADADAWIQRAGTTLANGEEVGAFIGGDPTSETEDLRRGMAAVLSSEIQGRGKGMCTLAEAANILAAGDAIFAQLSVAVVRSRIERFLARPVTLDTGHTIQAVVDGGKKLVTLT